MILILSYSSHEQSTEPVIDWLSYKKASFFRLTASDFLSKKSGYKMDVCSGLIHSQDNIIPIAEVNVVWYRRWDDRFKLADYPDAFPYDQLAFENTNELKALSNYFFSLLKGKKWLTAPDCVDVNKLDVLKRAADFGITVPASQVLNNKKDLIEFYHTCNQGLISKPIYHSGYFVDQDYTYSVYTNSFAWEQIEQLPDYFFPSLFQEKVESDYEIRSFYLDGTFYSSAIICTDKHSRDIDIKVNNSKGLTSWTPYQLPSSLENQLDLFMKSLGLNTGSIDILKTHDGRYMFLEVNPVGQFAAPSFRANYYLDEKVADWLISNDH